MRRHLTALLVAGLLVGACGGDDDDNGQAAVTSIPDETTTSSTTTTTEPRTVAPDVIPRDESQITEEYVEQVLNELFAVALETFTLTREAGVVDEPATQLIEATTSDSVFEQQVNDLVDFAFAKFEGMKSDPESVSATVVDVLEATDSCIVAELTTDASGLMESPPPTEPGERDFVRLLAATTEQRATGLNPTAWVFDEYPVTLDGSVPDLTCKGR